MPTTKTDNRSLPSKVAIRKWLLGKLETQDAYVLDCCTGAGKIWGEMGKHCNLRSWIRTDIKPRPGTGAVLKLSATQAINSLPLDLFNVIDIDTYGEPWEAYITLLEKIQGRQAPIGVLLTQGHVMQAGVSKASMQFLNIPESWDLPKHPNVNAYVAGLCLRQTWHYADVVHAAQIEYPNVTYTALHLRAHG